MAFKDMHHIIFYLNIIVTLAVIFQLFNSTGVIREFSYGWTYTYSKHPYDDVRKEYLENTNTNLTVINALHHKVGFDFIDNLQKVQIQSMLLF